MLVAYDAEEVVAACELGEVWVLDLRDDDDFEWPDLLAELSPYLDRCVFLVVPGKFGDAEVSLSLWQQLAPPALEYGYPLAFVSQYDARPDDISWEEMDVLLTDDAALSAMAADHELPVYPSDLNYRTIYLD